MATAAFIDEPAGWAPGAKHYECSDGTHLIVESSAETIPEGATEMIGELLTILGTDLQSTKQIVRPTVIIACNEDGTAIDLTPLLELPPGTSHADALTAAGYTHKGE